MACAVVWRKWGIRGLAFPPGGVSSGPLAFGPGGVSSGPLGCLGGQGQFLEGCGGVCGCVSVVWACVCVRVEMCARVCVGFVFACLFLCVCGGV